MIGAIIGDIAGSTYEFHNTRDYNFPLFAEGSSYTDDTICTIAIAYAILRNIPYRDSLIEWCRKYPHPMGAYGVSFSRWIQSENPQGYDSFGNGAAMRVSPIGWAYSIEATVQRHAEWSAKCSHSHPEGIKGAITIAKAVYILSHYHWKEAREQVSELCKYWYGSDYESRLPMAGQWDETCMGCVPLAIHLFLQSESFEDAIRKAVSYGGDSDTLGAIVGSLAGAYYEIPDSLVTEAMNIIPQEMRSVILRFIHYIPIAKDLELQLNKLGFHEDRI